MTEIHVVIRHIFEHLPHLVIDGLSEQPHIKYG